MKPEFLLERIRVTELIRAEIIKSTQQVQQIENQRELLIVNKGTLGITIGKKVFTLYEGMGAIIEPDEFRFVWQMLENTEYTVIGFDVDVEHRSELKNRVIELGEFENTLSEELYRLISGSTTTSERDSEIAALLELILIRCQPIDSGDAFSLSSAELFEKAADKMLANINGNISVSDLAEHLNVSLSNLKRTFLRFTSLGVHEYFLDRKIAYAKKLLKAGSSVTETALLTGFNNQNYFSAAFKKATGVSPKEFSNNNTVAFKTVKKQKTNSHEKYESLPSYLL